IRRMLSMMLPGSKPIACRMMPTSTHSSASRTKTARGEPPRKRSSPRAGIAVFGRSVVICCMPYPITEPSWLIRGTFALEHPFQGLQPVGFARRLVPAQPADAGKTHRHAGFVPGGTLQALEGDLHDQALAGLVRHLAHRAEAVDRVAPHIAVDL